MKDEDEDDHEDIELIKKENDELNKKLLEIKNEINDEKQKNNLLSGEIDELKIEKNKLFNENLELKLNCDKNKNVISILNEKITNLNSEIKSKNEENESLSLKVTSMIRLSNERFEEAKNIIENNINEMKKENKDWRNSVESFIGKKRENKEDSFINNEANNQIDIDEKREEEKRNNINTKKENIKLKMIIDNLRTENSLMKYRLLSIEKNKLNEINNVIEQNGNQVKNVENENNIKIE